MEAGERWMLNDVAGKPLYAWDSRDHRFRTAYDPLRRPTDSFLTRRRGRGDASSGGASMARRRPNPEDEQPARQGGRTPRSGRRRHQRRLRLQGQPAAAASASWRRRTRPRWTGPAPCRCEAETYTSRTRYDALNRPTQLIAPHSDQPGATVNVIQPSYNEANLLEQVDAWLNRNAEPAGWLDPATANLHAVTDIDYDAKGQRTRIDHGTQDGKVIRTSYAYDRETFRLTHLYTRRGVDPLTAQACRSPTTATTRSPRRRPSRRPRIRRRASRAACRTCTTPTTRRATSPTSATMRSRPSTSGTSASSRAPSTPTTPSTG